MRALAVVASTENVQGATAFRPGDILRAANGKTIEIINTDAEGRLVLADALHYARSSGATHLVDFATLTGAMSARTRRPVRRVVLQRRTVRGGDRCGGGASGDLACRFPLHPRYRRYIDSTSPT